MPLSWFFNKIPKKSCLEYYFILHLTRTESCQHLETSSTLQNSAVLQLHQSPDCQYGEVTSGNLKCPLYQKHQYQQDKQQQTSLSSSSSSTKCPQYQQQYIQQQQQQKLHQQLPGNSEQQLSHYTHTRVPSQQGEGCFIRKVYTLLMTIIIIHRMNEGYRARGALKSVLSNRGLGIKAKKCLYEE